MLPSEGLQNDLAGTSRIIKNDKTIAQYMTQKDKTEFVYYNKGEQAVSLSRVDC